MSVRELLATSIWPDNAPSNFDDLVKDFREKLVGLDNRLDVLATWYESKIYGWSEIEPVVDRWLELPDEAWEQEPSALAATLHEAMAGGAVGAELREPLRRARTIFLGHGGAGKTSLVNVINGGEATAADEVTRGAHLSDAILEAGKRDALEKADPTRVNTVLSDAVSEDVVVHFWDFGGQMMTHATHQFFLRARCLYVIVIDGRNRDDGGPDAEYWLSFLKAVADDRTPALLVGNKADASPVEVDLRTLKQRHENVRDFFKLSCTDKSDDHAREFERFLASFRSELSTLASAADGLTTKQAEALQTLDQHVREHGRLDRDDALALIEPATTPQGRTAEQLLAYFDLLGVVVWFQDAPELSHQVFSPVWITDGVYSVLYAPQAQKAGGRLSQAEFHQVLDASGRNYSAEEKSLIMQAMKAFKTAFEKRGAWIVPAILPVRAEDASFDTSEPLSARMRFEGFLPPQLLSQLICERQGEIVGDSVWRSGAHLKARGGLDAEALIRANARDRVLRIDVSGKDKQAYLGVLLDAAEGEIAEFPYLRGKQEIRLDPGAVAGDESARDGDVWAPLEDIRVAKANGIAGYPREGQVYQVDAVLGEAPIPPELRHGDVFLSYAHRDLALLKRLDARLYNAEVSVWWDRHGRDIGEGEWREWLRKRIVEARALIVLWSSDSAKSEVVQWEVAQAGPGKTIHLKTPSLNVSELPSEIAALQIFDWDDDDAIRRALEKRGVAMQ